MPGCDGVSYTAAIFGAVGPSGTPSGVGGRSPRPGDGENMKRVLGPWALCSMVAVLGFACDDDEGGGGCASDQACGRGMICEDGACKAVACTGLQSCPGTGRTCLVDIRQCSQKECADVVDGVETTCAPGASCIEDGPFRGSCVQPGGVSCGNTGDCLPLVGVACEDTAPTCASGQCTYQTACLTLSGTLDGLNGGEVKVSDGGERTVVTVANDKGEPDASPTSIRILTLLNEQIR